MTDRYPGYDVLAKRWTQSWNEPTRQVIDRRLAVPREPRFFSPTEWQTLDAVCDRIMPQPKIVRPFRCLLMSIRKWPMGCWMATAMPNCRRRARLGGAAWPRWIRRRARRTAAPSTTCRGPAGCAAAPHAARRTGRRRLGRHAMQTVLRAPGHS